MDITTTDDLLESINTIINFISDTLLDQTDDYYVALEIAHQLRDEVLHAIPED